MVKAIDRLQADKMEAAARRLRTAPHILLSDAIERHQDSARQLLDGLQLHYMPCLLCGRLDAWTVAAKAIIDLLADAPESPRPTETER